jgi:hypothetical protein
VRRLTSAVVLGLVAVTLGGCWDSSSETAKRPLERTGTATQPHSGPVPSPSQPGLPSRPADPLGSQPEGRLSAAEYASIKREYTLLNPLRAATDIQKAIDGARPACRAVERPNTPLITLVHEDCIRGLAFLGSLAELDKPTSSCGQPSTDDAAKCLADRYLKIALVTQFQLDNALELNDELARRKIVGLCARSIGITPGQVDNLRDISKYGREAAESVTLGDLGAFDRAQEQLLAAIRADDGSDPLTGIIRGCAHRSSRSRVPRPTPTPRTPPSPLPREPGDSGINA